MKKILIALALAGLTSASANAAINVRQLDQQRRIDAGDRSGKITDRERARLKAQQRAIAAQEHRMRARHNGHLTARDERILQAHQRQAERDIQREKRNGHHGRNRLGL